MNIFGCAFTNTTVNLQLFLLTVWDFQDFQGQSPWQRALEGLIWTGAPSWASLMYRPKNQSYGEIFLAHSRGYLN